MINCLNFLLESHSFLNFSISVKSHSITNFKSKIISIRISGSGVNLGLLLIRVLLKISQCIYLFVESKITFFFLLALILKILSPSGLDLFSKLY